MSSPIDVAALLQGGAMPQGSPAPAQQSGPQTPPPSAPSGVPAPQQANPLTQQPPQQQAAPQGNPAQQGPVIKKLLTNFFYGAGQSMLHASGMPTDYEKQQNAAALQQRQQQLDQTRTQIEATIALDKQKQQQIQYNQQEMPLPQAIADVLGRPTVARSDYVQALKSYTDIVQNKAEPLPDALSDRFGIARGTAVPHNMIPIYQGLVKNEAGAWTAHDANGQVGRMNKYTGEWQPSLDSNGHPIKSNAMVTGPATRWAGAAANAAYGVANVMDNEGNPTAISRAEQLRTGAPSMTEGQTMNLAGDKIGVNTYKAANKYVDEHQNVLDDPKQRFLVAQATRDVERDPSAFESVVNAYMQKGLTPEGAQIVASFKQMKEFGATFKKYTGNTGVATDSVRATINGNQASSSNSRATNSALLKQDRDLADKVEQMLTRPGAHAPHARPGVNSAPLPPSGGADPFAAFGGKTR